MAHQKYELLLRELEQVTVQDFVRPYEKSLNPPMELHCGHCKNKSAIRYATMYSWPDREHKNCGWVVTCPKCGSRIAPPELNQIIAQPEPTTTPQPTPVRQSKKLPLLVITLTLVILLARFMIIPMIAPFFTQQSNNPDRIENQTNTTTPTDNTESPIESESPFEAEVEHEPVMESYYEVIMEDISWYDAYYECQARTHNGVSGHLATITSYEEYQKVVSVVEDFIASHGTKADELYYIWLGAKNDTYSCHNQIDNFEWITGEAWTFDRWCHDITDEGIIINEPSFYDEQNDNVLEECLVLWGYNHEELGWSFSDQSGNLLTVYPASQGQIAYICEYDESEQVMES